MRDSTPRLCTYLATKDAQSYLYEMKGGSGQTGHFHSLALHSTCAYCGHGLTEAAKQSKKNDGLDWSGFALEPDTLRVLVCDRCGWWLVQRTIWGYDLAYEYQVLGIAKRYSIGDLDVPLAELRRFLARNPTHLAHVNPRAMELLMRDCVKEKYGPCEVIHTGGAGDGGVDLKLVTCDKDTYLVQVKRRGDLSRKEGVRAVRELNGVLFREGVAKGMVITTARAFTAAAYRETHVRTPTHATYHVDLFAFNEIVAMLRLGDMIPYQPWADSIRRLSLDNKFPPGFDASPDDFL